MYEDDSVEILTETVVKIENVKDEADDNLEKTIWNFIELNDAPSLKNTVKEEDYDEDELAPPATVFVDPVEVKEEEIKQEYEDPLLSCSDNLMNTFLETEENLQSPNTAGGGSPAPRGSQTSEEQTSEPTHGDCTGQLCEGEAAASTLTYPFEMPLCEMRATHMTSIRTFQSNMSIALPFVCNTCRVKLSTRKSAIAHIQYHTLNDPCKCTKCTKCSSAPAEGTKEVKYNQVDPEEGPFECDKCKRCFLLKSNVVQHALFCTGLPYCPICKKEYASRQGVIKHMASHRKEILYGCTVCQKDFSGRKDLISHMLTTHSFSGPCSICKVAIKDRKTLGKHLFIHFGKESYKCSICRENFSERKKLISHMCEIPQSFSEYCLVCKVAIKDQESLVKHMYVHFGKKSYKCSICQKNFKGKCSLANHMLFHSEKTQYKCFTCQKGFVERSSFHQHRRTRVHMQTVPHQCSICNKICKTVGRLCQHMRTHNLKIHHKSLPNKAEVVRNMASHNGENLHCCPICQRNFSESQELILHMQVHTQAHHCSICEVKFKDYATFIRHMHTHSGEELYGCPICQRSFSGRESFVTHMQVHVVERPFECSVCKESFSARGDLLTHLDVHVGKVKTECAVCQKSFRCTSSWQSHLRMHIRGKLYECSLCQQQFADRRKLFEHVWKHVGERKWGCSICSKKFEYSSGLVRHILTHSEEEHVNAQRVNSGTEKLTV